MHTTQRLLVRVMSLLTALSVLAMETGALKAKPQNEATAQARHNAIGIVKGPADVSACPGQTATFAVQASAGLSPLNYQWLKDNLPLSDGGRISGANTP